MSDSTRYRRTRRCSFESLEDRQLLSGTITVGIGRRFDLDGNEAVITPRVAIVGQAAPRSLVRLDLGGDGRFERVTRANARGDYQFLTPLRVGRQEVRVQATGQDGSVA